MEKITCMQFGSTVQSEISSIFTNAENMREIDPYVPQFYDYERMITSEKV
jgi:hypothetical protein